MRALRCPQCHRNFVVQQEFIDLRTNGGEANERPEDELPLGDLSWPALVRHLAGASDDPDATLAGLTGVGWAACTMLLALRPGRRILTLGCGAGMIGGLIRDDVERCYTVDYDPLSLRVLARNPAVQHHRQRIAPLLIDPARSLPLPEEYVDIVIASAADVRALVRPVGLEGGLAELRRVLDRRGQLLLFADNRLVRDRSTRGRPGGALSALSPGATPEHTHRGYAKHLKRSGLATQACYGLRCKRGQLFGISPLRAPAAPWRLPAAKSLRNWIARSPLAIASYAFVASQGKDANASFLESLLEDIRSRLQMDEPLAVQRFSVGRKDKLVLQIRSGLARMVVRIAFSPAASLCDRNNARMLELARARNAVRNLIPEPLLSARSDGIEYFVESLLSGRAVSSGLTRKSLPALLREAEDVLAALNPGVQTARLSDSLYATEVVQRIEKVEATISGARGSHLRRYFDRRLDGADVPIGLLHGDFGITNLLEQDGRIVGLIDWEGGDRQSVPLLDAINLVESIERLFTGKKIGYTIPAIAARQFVSHEEERFLADCFARWKVDPELHEPLVYLRWLRHMAYLCDFWLPYDERAVASLVSPVIAAIERRCRAAGHG